MQNPVGHLEKCELLVVLTGQSWCGYGGRQSPGFSGVVETPKGATDLGWSVGGIDVAQCYSSASILILVNI